MWVPRTNEEVAKWQAATGRDARSHGLVVSVICWLVLTAVLAGGWIAGGRMGVVAQDSVSGGSFWTRFPIFSLLGLPFAFWLFRRERHRELGRLQQMTICPKCETTGE